MTRYEIRKRPPRPATFGRFPGQWARPWAIYKITDDRPDLPVGFYASEREARAALPSFEKSLDA